MGSDRLSGRRKPQFVATMRAREDVHPGVIEKILCDNPRKFYSL
jgi:hypothetical protein